jgi:hypothetical protein
MTSEVPFRFFDCDNHYYEALDAFTRHIEPAFRKRAMQWAQIDGKTRLLVGCKVNKFIPNPRPEGREPAVQLTRSSLW